MKSTFRMLVAVSAALWISYGTTNAQDLSTTLNALGSANVSTYISPLLNSFAAGMNNAIYYSADLHGVLGFDIGLRVGVVKIKDDAKSFDFVMPDQISFTSGANTVTLYAGADYDKTTSAAPTVAGSTDPFNVLVKNTSIYTALRGQKLLPVDIKGFNVGYLGSFAPQINVGLPLGLEVMARYSPPIPAGDFGKVAFAGFGLRYDVDQFLPLFPVDIAVHFMTQSITMKDKAEQEIFTGKGTAYGVEVSKSLLFLTVFGGFQLQSAKMKLGAIDGKIGNTPYHLDSFEQDGPNKSQVTVGVRVLLLLVNVHAEANFAGTPTYGLGVGITFR